MFNYSGLFPKDIQHPVADLEKRGNRLDACSRSETNQMQRCSMIEGFGKRAVRFRYDIPTFAPLDFSAQRVTFWARNDSHGFRKKTLPPPMRNYL